ncbi:MAG: hypothetical protein K8U03_09060 [Planctomycetia bacterium]|nr:hypothetical protein [Planctomycetia bacterium]
MNLAVRLYNRIGIHTAAPGTLLHYVHHAACFLYGRTMARIPFKDHQVSGDVTVAFRVSGGIGDHLIAARYIRDLLDTVGDFKFDVFSLRPETAKWIFSSFKQFNACYEDSRNWKAAYHNYPLAMWLMSFVVAFPWAMKRAAIQKGNSKLLRVTSAIEKFMPKIELFVHNHPRLDAMLAQTNVYMNMNRYSFLQRMSGFEYGGPRLDLVTDSRTLSRFGLEGRQYVTVHNGFDNQEALRVGEGKPATKCYTRFGEVVALLRESYPDLCFVQLGTKTSTPISEVDVNLIDRTSVQETAEVIRHSLFHLDNESGLVHMAACLGVESCVVFGPTSVEYFGYEENVNVRPTFCGGCWWSTGDWLKRCPRGFEEARCMTEQPPEAVVAALMPRLSLKLSRGGVRPVPVAA